MVVLAYWFLRQPLMAIFYILTSGVFFGACWPGGILLAEEKGVSFEVSKLSIMSPNEGRRHSFTVEIAETEEQRMRGLMFRQSLPRDRGMLFLFGRPQFVAMWMKETRLPLDIAFINEEGVIVDIIKSTVPYSTRQLKSSFPVVAAFEVNAGVLDSYNIRVGYRVDYPFFSK